jgi:hypothetical protein
MESGRMKGIVRIGVIVAAGAVAGFVARVAADDPPPAAVRQPGAPRSAGPAPGEPDPAKLPPPPVVEVGEGVYQFGVIRIDKKARALSFPAEVNMDRELVEFFCVTERGRTHEAVLLAKLVPRHLHLAMLLLAEKGSVPEPVEADQTRPLQNGMPVLVTVNWKTDAGESGVPASRLITHAERKQSPADDVWIYTGGRVLQGAYIADTQGDIIAIMENIDSLINISDTDRSRDDPWRANEALVPPVGTPVEVTITLPERKAE